MKGTIIGLADTLKVLREFTPSLRKKILRPAISKSTKPVLSAAKRYAARETGLLAKSLKRKVKSYKGAVVAVIGPDQNVQQEVTRPGRRKPANAKPANYVHLVEFGTRPHTLAKGDKLARTGEMEVAATARTAARLKRWREEVNKIGALPRTIKAQKRRSKLLDRIHRVVSAQARRRETIQTAGANQHPGSKPQPFLRPAHDITKAQVQQIFAAEVKAGIEKHAKRI